MTPLSPAIFGASPLTWAWYVWGVFVAFAIAIVAAFWIFYDAQQKMLEATVWKVVTVVATILILPSLVLRVDPVLASGMLAAIEPLAYLGIVAGVAALFALFAYGLRLGVTEIYVPPPPPPPAPAPEPIPPTEEIAPPAYEPFPVAPQPAETISLRREPPRLAWLVVRSGPRTGREFRLGEVTSIGRDATRNDVVIDDPAISRQHAKVKLEDGQFVLYDLASANGTFVNDEQIQKRALVNGDMIKMGETLFAFMEVQEKKGEA